MKYVGKDVIIVTKNMISKETQERTLNIHSCVHLLALDGNWFWQTWLKMIAQFYKLHKKNTL